MKTDRKKKRRDDRKKKKLDKRRQGRARREVKTVDASRNLHAERGRPIVVSDITPYARQKCANCRGKGIVGYRSAGDLRGAEPCACAHKRFVKAHPEIIVDAQGVAFWPAEEKRWDELSDAQLEKIKETGEPPEGVTIVEEPPSDGG